MPKFRDLTNIDLSILSDELRFLKGSRVRKAYQYSETEFRIKFSVPEKGSMDVAITLPASIHLTKQSKESPEPPTFAMTLRKHLENKKVEGASQWNLDRIFVFEFAEYKLIAEFYGKGNLILTDSTNKIIMVSRPEETKVRKIRRGEIYIFPEMKRKNPSEISDSLFKEAMQEKDKEKLHLIAFLSKRVNLPPFYWEEILFRVGVEPLTPIAKCSEKIFTSIVSHTKEFVEEIKTPNTVLYSDGTYSIIPLQNRKEQEYEKFSSYSELIDKIYSLQATQEVSKVHVEKQEKIQRKLQQQKKHLEELLKGVEDKQKTGNLIIERERQLNSMIEEYKQMKKSNKKPEEIEKRLSELFGSQIKLEKGKITFEV